MAPTDRSNTGDTLEGIDRLRKAGKISSDEEENGRYGGHFVIGHETGINGGVYVGRMDSREAIVVSDEGLGGQALRKVYSELQRKISELPPLQIAEGGVRMQILKAVKDLVREKMPFNSQAAKEIVKQVAPDQKVSLGLFLGRGGVCRHQALLAAYLIEKLIADMQLTGRVAVERNTIGPYGGHAWAVYVDSLGSCLIIDPSNDVVGKPEDLTNWVYKREPFGEKK